MPWNVRKRSCKQKSTGKTGSHVVVKVKGGGGEEQESCHTSEPKAQGALRARYASKNEAALRPQLLRRCPRRRDARIGRRAGPVLPTAAPPAAIRQPKRETT